MLGPAWPAHPEGTATTHVAAVLRKLDLRDRTQAAVAAYELGLVRPRG